MIAHHQLAILGGGCAGLSLAKYLSAGGNRCPKTLILEHRAQYTNDRTWCFWDDGSFNLDHLISHRWSAMIVSARGQSATIDCGETPYALLPALAFYQDAIQCIAQNSAIELATDTRIIGRPRRVSGAWEIVTDRGVVTADWVIDARPSIGPQTVQVKLWQSFVGQVVECTDTVFDPERGDLMQFLERDDDRIQFTYVLPLSKTCALIEVTVFDRARIDAQALAGDLALAIAQRTRGAAVTVIREERGILPMGLLAVPEPSAPNFARAGLTAGGARSSSGYAFRRIQGWAKTCAATILAGSGVVGHQTDPALLRLMDAIFLSVLVDNPRAAPDIFLRLFKNADPPRLIRFMNDGGSLVDYAAVAAALPVPPFLHQLGLMTTTAMGLRARAACL
jgi:lycopene beta-cyclase